LSTRILLAFGGNSPEHEVSVITALQAAASLKELGNYELIPLYIAKDSKWYTGPILLDLSEYEHLNELLTKAKNCSFAHDKYGRVVLRESESSSWFSKPQEFVPDIALLAFHGAEGENGSFQGLCEQYNLAYTGSGVLASATGMDKDRAKQLAKRVRIPVVDGFVIDESTWVEKRKELQNQMDSLGFPLIVKPKSLGSSIGVGKIMRAEDATSAIESALQYDSSILIEKMVTPLTEVNCSVLSTVNGYEVSVCEMPKGSADLLSFDDKYLADTGAKGMASADRIIPAPIDDALKTQIQEYTLELAKAFDLGGVARLDFLMNAETKEIYFNEVNTIPGSFSFYLWKHNGKSFGQLLQDCIADGLKRHQLKTGRVRHYTTNLLSKRASTGLKSLKNKA
jgi:D-alanine-D-alanine ligase